MLKRKIDQKIATWKSTKTNQGLLITGARQVGKTSSIKNFADHTYGNVISIDFVEMPHAAQIISEAKNLDDLIIRITALASKPLPESASLLFFDEIQECQDSVTWMRYLANDGRFDVIYSGSMLGVSAYDYRSLPVGTLDIIEMFPLDFEEFTWALDIDKSLWNIVENCYNSHFDSASPDSVAEVPGFIHDVFMDAFIKYVLVGGMPEAVQVFVSQNDTQAMRARQTSIVNAYRHDISKYVNDLIHAQRIKTIYNALPSQLAKENKRFVVSGIDKKKRFADLRPDFTWLVDAGVALPVTKATEASFPLGLSEENSFFKLYMNDVGLLFSTFAPVDVEALILNQDSINFGGAFENVVAQELRAHGHADLHYYHSKKIGEIDFLLENKATPAVQPIEVKSGKSSWRHTALNNLLAVSNYNLINPIVLHKENCKTEGKITYLPVYMAAFL